MSDETCQEQDLTRRFQRLRELKQLDNRGAALEMTAGLSERLDERYPFEYWESSVERRRQVRRQVVVTPPALVTQYRAAAKFEKYRSVEFLPTRGGC